MGPTCHPADLADTEEGGETVFPNVPAPNGDNGPEFSECARYNLAAKPKKGNAVLFHSIKPSGELERRSLHTACPVIKGVKWSAPKWIHVGHVARGSERPQYVELHPQSSGGPPGKRLYLHMKRCLAARLRSTWSCGACVVRREDAMPYRGGRGGLKATAGQQLRVAPSACTNLPS